MGIGRGGFDAFHILGIIVWGMASLVALLIIVGILILLVRYLLVATKSHQLYLANNSPAAPAEPSSATPAGAAPTSPTPTTPAPTTPTPTTPAPRTRTPKSPPAV